MVTQYPGQAPEEVEIAIDAYVGEVIPDYEPPISSGPIYESVLIATDTLDLDNADVVKFFEDLP